jgi:hypothetical protein
MKRCTDAGTDARTVVSDQIEAEMLVSNPGTTAYIKRYNRLFLNCII